MPPVAAPPILVAASSLALRPLLERGATAGTVLGSERHAAWVRAGRTILAVVGEGAVRLPNAIAVPGPVGLWVPGGEVLVGEGRIAGPAGTVEVVRWWDPRPVLPAASAAAIRERAAAVRAGLPWCDDSGLGPALRSGGRRLRKAANRLMGRGPGLTPLGDDLLCGVLAGLALLGPASGSRVAARRLRTLRVALTAAPDRTTALSAALLAHAGRGEVADRAAPLLQALCGRGDATAAAAGLLSVGHTSGMGLARGIVLAGEAL